MSESAQNVIVFLSDQQRWDTSAIFGNPLDLTPNFDSAAMAGTHLYHCYSNQPVCGPARSMMQSGQYATQTGCYRNNIPLAADEARLAPTFREAGFKTGYIGKWHLGDHEPVPESERGGYEYWLAANMLEFTSDAYHTVVYDNDNAETKLPGFRVDAMTDAAIRFIDRCKNERFFLFLSFLEPHHQNHLDNYPGRLGDEERYAGRWTPPDLQALGGTSAQHLPGYFAMVNRLDDAFGRIRDALHSLGLGETTTILSTSDHGCHFKTRNTEYKRSCHEGSVRVPGALIGGPFTGGGRITDMVSTIDFAPTLIDAAGLDVPDAMMGNSVRRLVDRQADVWPDDVFIQLSEDVVGRAIRTERWKYGVVAPDADGWDDMYADTYEETFLYDLKADPWELDNLVGKVAFRDVADGLLGRLRRRIKEVEGKDATITPAPATASGRRSVEVWDSDAADAGSISGGWRDQKAQVAETP